jgi:hypothetical protein
LPLHSLPNGNDRDDFFSSFSQTRQIAGNQHFLSLFCICSILKMS